MANEPHGDVEILLTAPDEPTKPRAQHPETPSQNSHLKIRLRQERRVVEISKHTSRDGRAKSSDAVAGEWTKKVLPVPGAGYCIDLGAFGSDDAEIIAAQLFYEFLATCRAVADAGARSASETEGSLQRMDRPSLLREPISDEAPVSPSKRHAPHTDALSGRPSNGERTCATAGSSIIVADESQSIARLSVRTNLPPRPGKFNPAPTPRPTLDANVSISKGNKHVPFFGQYTGTQPKTSRGAVRPRPPMATRA